MIRGIQVVGLLVGLMFLYQSYRLVKEKKEDVGGFLLWSTVGAGVIVVSIHPGVFDYLLTILQMKERPFAIFTVGILVAYLLLFQTFKLLRTLSENVSKLNESMSILRYEMEKGKKGQ
ncbi:MAG: DUF2304 domain-containing protein [Candidatus Hydrothermarchaeaceae archaeon]